MRWPRVIITGGGRTPLRAVPGKRAIAALFLWATFPAGCGSPRNEAAHFSPAPPPTGRDTTLLSVIVRHVAGDAAAHHVALRIDPRPLKADPAIVELAPRVALAAPGLVSAIADPLAEVSVEAVDERARVLERTGIPAMDVYAHPACPGMLEIPPDLREGGRTHPDCPTKAFTVAILGLPRPGGAYWPGSRVDERQQNGRDVWSVRMIQRHLQPAGVNMVASDVVVERTPAGIWRVVKVVPLLFVE